MRVARLIATVVLLLNKGTVTARELAQRFEVSTRTIYRDIDALASAGIPVYSTRGSSGGISLMEGYMMERTLVTDAESECLLFALKTLQSIQYPDAHKLLEKLASLVKGADVDWLEVGFAPWGRGAGEEVKFGSIRRALLEQRLLEFQYVGADGSRSQRTVEPMKLYFKGSCWYLWAWCRMREAFRTFRVTRIRELALRDELFARREQQFQRETSKQDWVPPVELRLRFHPRVAYRIYDDFDDSSVARNPDGTLEVSTSFPEDDWVYGYLLSYGPDVEVLAPEHIRRILREKMKKALRKY